MAPNRAYLPGEVVVYNARPHLLYFSLPVVWGFPLLVLLVAHFRSSGFLADAIRVIMVPASVVWAGWSAWRMLQWFFTRFTVTSHRVMWRTGVVARNGVEIPMERVSNVNFHQSILERIFGAGDLVIESSGAEGQSRFSDIRHPDDVQLMIHAEIATAHGRPTSGATPPRPESDLVERLARLDEMRSRGVISPDEFIRAKQRLLDEV